ncbi:filamentous hemagglutinin N-terminal domain-containing protein [Allocoleopsis sp.]|uniref:filamentous hemagglutinin N-terminal domain-containing protein n=1 Tax=Allocoleopsis sp. TaxID=3088169 RepID=UPI002FD05C63
MSRSRNFGLEKTGLLEALWAFVQLCLVVALPNIPTLAQMTPDTTLGAEGSRITPGANVQGLPADLIEGGAIRQSNLFHSFSEFNVNNGQRVYFANPIGIDNIFSRVTGTNISNILGTLGVNGKANLFLLNPNGIIFGSNARLDINGSFLATTANSFQFPDGTQFSATNPQSSSLLSINVPLGVQYGAQPGKITVNQTNLEVSSQQNLQTSLTLLGGDVELAASKLTAPGRFLELGGLAGEGSVGLKVDGSLVMLGEFTGMHANVSISGTTISATATGTSDKASGDISMTGRNIQITDSKIESVGNDQSYGTITIKASDSVFLNNTILDTQNKNGVGGDVLINASNQISITNKSKISSEGSFGQILIGSSDPDEAKDPIKPRTVVIDNSTLTSETASTDGNSDDPGLVSIRANDSVEIKNGSQLNATTSGMDDAGNIAISVPNGTVVINNGSKLLSEATKDAQGNAGYIEIKARNLLIDKAQVSINDQSLDNPTKATNVDINDLDSFDDIDDIEKLPGRIYISAEQMTLDNQARIEANSASVDGGNIYIEASEWLLLRRGSLISAEADTAQQGGGGKGGNITINAKDGFVVAVPSENSDFIANAFDGDGGKINIAAKRIFGLKRQRGQSTSQLRSNRSSDISASSKFGFEGEIEINTLDLDPAQGLVELPITLIDPTGLIAQGCESRNSGVAKGQSTFVVTGRGGLPPNPDNPLSTGATPPPWVTRDSGKASKAAAVVTLPSSKPTTTLVEAQGMVIGSKGEIILTAGVAAATPHPSGFSASGCSGER